MLGWLYRVLIGSFKSCDHEWEIYKQGNMYIKGRCIGHWYTQKCKKCGDIRHHKSH